MASGDTAAATPVLDSLRFETWQHYNVASAFFSLQYERFLYARALHHAGRVDEALRWYATSKDTSLRDLVFLVPGHFFRGEILESRGDTAGALTHYRRVTERWAEADPALQRYVDDARAGIARLEGQ
jgi:tetratricopeptide (TPR) repeat protein